MELIIRCSLPAISDERAQVSFTVADFPNRGMVIPWLGSCASELPALGYFTISAFSIMFTPSREAALPFTVIV